MQVKKTETNYEISNAAGEKVWLQINHEQKKVDLTRGDGKQFDFLSCNPEYLQSMGELISEAGRVAQGQFIDDVS